MSTTYCIGIDNGSSGSVGILGPSAPVFTLVPTVDCLHYGKAASISKRLDRVRLRSLLLDRVGEANFPSARTVVERPFSNGKFVKAMLSSHRFFEGTIITLEDLGLGYEVVDSGPWQKAMLGNVSGSAELKHASMLRGCQIYPHLQETIRKHKDADGLLIAHYHHYLGTLTS